MLLQIISEKYVEGLFNRYVSDILLDTQSDKIRTIVTPVDFQHLKDVFVITVNKKDSQRKGRGMKVRSFCFLRSLSVF